jgi:hypothetical protein
MALGELGEQPLLLFLQPKLQLLVGLAVTE